VERTNPLSPLPHGSWHRPSTVPTNTKSRYGKPSSASKSAFVPHPQNNRVRPQGRKVPRHPNTAKRLRPHNPWIEPPSLAAYFFPRHAFLHILPITKHYFPPPRFLILFLSSAYWYTGLMSPASQGRFRNGLAPPARPAKHRPENPAPSRPSPSASRIEANSNANNQKPLSSLPRGSTKLAEQSFPAPASALLLFLAWDAPDNLQKRSP